MVLNQNFMITLVFYRDLIILSKQAESCGDFMALKFRAAFCVREVFLTESKQ